ncbi:unnamed protein product [Adineta steineri]|uniref:Uncharacterized protein n=2 Tax=Adineta steineri TaxID=433720 RepID=A0A814LLM3_9BILA|nr:unnamed protein product [Adineta steineri]
MKCDEQSTNHLKQLRGQLAQLFSNCLKNDRNTYNPHMTVAQFDSQEEFNQAKPSLILNESFEFPVQYLYILQRPHDNDTTPFHIVHQISLGPMLHSVSYKQFNSVHIKLQEFFQTMNLYESNESYQRKRDKFEKLSSCFQQVFNKETLHCFAHSFLPYGSFRIGINGQDVDTVFLLNEIKSMNTETTFDETQINGNFKNEIIYCMNIEALFSIISTLFNDQTKVEIFVQIELNNEQLIELKVANDLHLPESIHGVHDIERLLAHVRAPPIFQHLLIYILKQFFSTFAQFNWSTDAFCLYPESYKPVTYSERPQIYQRGSMRIISLSPPFNNAARATKKSTRNLIIQGFQHVVQLLDSINIIITEDKSNALEQILDLNNDFPNEKMKSIDQIITSSETINEFDS